MVTLTVSAYAMEDTLKVGLNYGSSALFLYFSPMSRENADKILAHAEKYWSDGEGSFTRECRKRDSR